MEVVKWVLSAASLVHWCLQSWMNWRHKAWLKKHLHELESEEIELFIDLLIYGLIYLIQPLSLSRHRNSHLIYNINISLFFQGTVRLLSTALLWRTLLPFFHSPTFFFLSSILHLSSSSPSSSSSSSSPSSSSLLLVILLLHHLFFPRNLSQLSSITPRTG